MSELASVEELRNFYMKGCTCSDPHTVITCGVPRKVREIADEIEREVSKRFMELPVDMNGVPIRPGDTVVVDGEEIVVSSVERRCWVDAQGYIYSPKGTSHVRLRTVEDVLFDYEDHILTLKEAAAELRGMMEADE